ncbi:hypothetical protein CPB86DRAFT_386962 [Serendipita vermifera]|nr:hypothetical protein CPB86DRAFT_386962 [Serendipita vermifera]
MVLTLRGALAGLAAVTLSTFPVLATKPQAPAKFWVSFGDSYTQTWFNVTGDQPNLSNALGNPPWPGYSACGSRLSWPTQVTGVFNTSFVKVYNHAYGGAVIDKTLVTPWRPDVKDLIEEVDDFLAWDAPGKPLYPNWQSHNTIFAFWMGINDIGNSFWLEGDRDAFSDVLLAKYFELVEKIYAVGARHFLFLNVPPIQRTPFQLGNADETSRVAEYKVIQGYNRKLKDKLKAFEKSHRGVTTLLYDTDALLTKLLDNPQAYGFANATGYGDVDDLIWCNDYHISPKANYYIAKDVAKLLKGRFI